jgi:hypothetical protein
VLGLAALIGAGLLVARALIPSSSALPAPRVASALTEAPMPSARVSLSVSSAPSGETAPPTVPVESLPLAPASAAVTPSAPSATPAASPVTPAASAPAPTTETELAFLQRAQDSLATEPARTLALCAEHAQRFPRGVLGEEREVLAIDALTRLGHRDAAEARARRFLVTYPTSAHKRRIEQLLGGD